MKIQLGRAVPDTSAIPHVTLYLGKKLFMIYRNFYKLFYRKLAALHGQESNDELLKEGQNFLDSGHVNRALILFKEVLRRQRVNEKALKHLGIKILGFTVP